MTPNFNGSKTLSRTIDSVIDQGYESLEYFVLDAASTDASVSIIEAKQSFLSGWRSREDEGQYFAINEGLNQSTGEIMGWLNSDDFYYPWTFKLVNEIFRKFPDVEWITGIPVVAHQGIPKAVKPLRLYAQELVASGACDQVSLRYIQQESTFWRRSLWNRVGGLNTKYSLAADFDLWTRFAKHSPLYSVNSLFGSFHDRGQENRSHKHGDHYVNEVREIQHELGPEAAKSRSLFIKRKHVYERLEKIPVVRRFYYKNIISLYVAPVIKWSQDSREYEIENRMLLG